MIARMAPCKQVGAVRVKGVTRSRRGVAGHTSPHHVAPRWPLRRPCSAQWRRMVSEAGRMRTGALVRRHRVATVVLARRSPASLPPCRWRRGQPVAAPPWPSTSSSAVSDPPDVLIDFCPAGVEPGSPDDLRRATRTSRRPSWTSIRSMPLVSVHAARASWTMMLVADERRRAARAGDDDPGRRAPTSPRGRAIRSSWPAGCPTSTPPTSCWSATARRRRSASSAGSEIWISDVRGRNGAPFASTVVGVVRTVGELVPERSDSPLASGNPMFHASARRGRRPTATTCCGRRTASACSSTAVTPSSSSPSSSSGCPAACSTPPARRLRAARHRPPSDGLRVEAPRPASPWLRPLAGAFLVAQAVARQSRRESDDRAVLHRPRRHPPRPRRVVLVAVGRDGSARRCGQRRRRRRGEHARARSASAGAGRGPRGVTIDPVVLAVGVPAVFALVIAAGVRPDVAPCRTHARSASR